MIVFTRTKRAADRVAECLDTGGVRVSALHGNKSQPARQKALEQFRSGRARVLVATDIAARGIDVTGISHVINFDLPAQPEDYVHRIGRTARAGASGRRHIVLRCRGARHAARDRTHDRDRHQDRRWFTARTAPGSQTGSGVPEPSSPPAAPVEWSSRTSPCGVTRDRCARERRFVLSMQPVIKVPERCAP